MVVHKLVVYKKTIIDDIMSDKRIRKDAFPSHSFVNVMNSSMMEVPII